MSVDGGTSRRLFGRGVGRRPQAACADAAEPDGRRSIPPTSLALTQPGPAWRVSPSPPYSTNSQSGRLSICLSVLHWGSVVKTTDLSFGPERNAVSEWFFIHCAVRSDLTAASSASAAGRQGRDDDRCGPAGRPWRRWRQSQPPVAADAAATGPQPAQDRPRVRAAGWYGDWRQDVGASGAQHAAPTIRQICRLSAARATVPTDDQRVSRCASSPRRIGPSSMWRRLLRTRITGEGGGGGGTSFT